MSQIPFNQRPIGSTDWKAFKRIRARALERFARRTLEACRELMDEDEKETVARMLSLPTLLRQETKKFRRLEEHQGRSSILHGLLHFKAFDLLDEDDLASLSLETRRTILDFAKSQEAAESKNQEPGTRNKERDE